MNGIKLFYMIKNNDSDFSFVNEKLLFVLCFLLAGLICVAQIIGSVLLLAILLICFLLLIILASDKNYALPVLLFFLPWSSLLKIDVGGFSFYTIALLLTCIWYQLKNSFRLRFFQIVIPAAICILTLIGKVLQANGFDMEYVFFFSMLVFFPEVTRNVADETSFIDLCIFFAFGIICAAFSAQYVAKFPNIMRYITVDSYQSVTRLSGYYGDPNYYSAHITACISGVLLLLNQEESHFNQLLLNALLVVLIYCGLLSASKTFVIVTTVLLLVWIPVSLKNRGKWNQKIRIIVGILCALTFMFISPVFQKLFSILDDRFAYAANVSQLTTGRTDIWKRYLVMLSHKPTLLLFGEGYSSVLLFNKAAHNSLIQLVFQFGLFGTPLVIIWIIQYLRDMKPEELKDVNLVKDMLLMFVGVVGPWLSLDILFFDEFFLLPVFLLAGTCYTKRINAQIEITSYNNSLNDSPLYKHIEH